MSEPEDLPSDELVETVEARDLSRRWRVFGFALLVTALAGLLAGGAGYGYYRWVLTPRDANLEQALADAQQERARMKTRLDAFEQAHAEALEAHANALTQKQQRLHAALIERLNEVANQAPPTEREWRLAEVEYLLRVANHRLLMEQDLATALDLLGSADALLASLNDPGLHLVRAALADERLALKGLVVADVQGLYLRLDSIKRGLSALARAMPEFGPPPVVETPADAGPPERLEDRVLEQLRGLVRFRRIEPDAMPVIAPEEAAYLDLNLRLMLEQAQLAALKRDQVVYQASLGNAHEWAARYLNAEDPQVLATLNTLLSLREIPLDSSLPDISGSLDALLEVRRKGP